MLERPERFGKSQACAAACCCLLLAALFCSFSFDWKLLLFRTCGFWHTHPSPTAEGRAVQWRCILYIMLISLCVVMGIRTFHTVLPPRLQCFDTVRNSHGANLVGCRGQREQSMVGPHQGATLNLAGIAGHFGASKIPALVAIFLLLLLLLPLPRCTARLHNE